jgi:hypothetical protein
MPFGTRRQPNNPAAIDLLFPVIKAVINVDPVTGLGNTVLAQLSASGTGVERVFIEDKASLVLSDFPNLLLETGEQVTNLAGKNQYEAQVPVIVTYYDRWDRNPSTIDALHIAMRQDLERMKANLETNQGLVYQGSYHSMAIPTIKIGAYSEELDNTMPTVTLVKCPMTITVNSLPYDA